MLLLPDLNRANSKKQLQYNIDLKEDNFENNGKDASFCSFQKKLAVVMDFLTLQDKRNVCTLLVDIKLISNRCKIGQKSLPI